MSASMVPSGNAVLDDIKLVVGNRLPDGFIEAVYRHMEGNHSNGYNHHYLKHSLVVASTLMRRSAEFDEHERKTVFAVVMLLETGQALTHLYPYDASPGMAWFFLRTFANGEFIAEDERFITQNCRPQKPVAMRVNTYTKMQVVLNNTKKLTDVVTQNLSKVYAEFVETHDRLAKGSDLETLFNNFYGESGNLWGGISESARGIFASEIALFKKSVTTYLNQKC